MFIVKKEKYNNFIFDGYKAYLFLMLFEAMD
mgnify:CR=1 FL=1